MVPVHSTVPGLNDMQLLDSFWTPRIGSTPKRGLQRTELSWFTCMNVGNAKNISQDARLYCLLIPTHVFAWFFYSELAHIHFLIPMFFFLTVTWSCKIMWLNCFAVLWWDNKQSHFLPVLNTFELDSRGLSHVYPHALWCDSWSVAFLSS